LLFCEEVPFRTPRHRNKVFWVFVVNLWRITFSYTTRQKQGISSIFCYSAKKYPFVRHERDTRNFEYLLLFCEEVLFVNHEAETRCFEYLLLFCEEIPFLKPRERNNVFRVVAVILWRRTFSYTERQKQSISSICCYSVKKYLFVNHETETRYFEYLLLFCEEVLFCTSRDRNKVFRVFSVIMWRSTFSYTTRKKQDISSICVYSVKKYLL
jgi:hypothetical protein